MSSFRRNAPVILALLACLFASGTQWGLVQAFAWAKMFAANVESMPLTTALARTFDPEKKCELCHAVTAAKQQQDDAASTAPRAEGRHLTSEPIDPIVVAPVELEPWPAHPSIAPDWERKQPPVPPPRAG